MTPLLRLHLSIHRLKSRFHAFFASIAEAYRALARGDDKNAVRRHLRSCPEMGFGEDAPEAAQSETPQGKAVKE